MSITLTNEQLADAVARAANHYIGPAYEALRMAEAALRAQGEASK